MEQNTYVLVMIDTLSKKYALLERLHQSTLAQEKYIQSQDVDLDEYETLYQEKEVLIEELNKLDVGFEKVYTHVKEELSNNSGSYKDAIKQLQQLIRMVSEKSAMILALEKSNKEKFQLYFAKQKQEIKTFKRSNQTVTNYYKSMTEGYGNDVFLDRKK